MPHADHRVACRRGVAAALLPALIFAAAPASAAKAHARLAVHATVLPSCLVSADAARRAAVSCTHGGRLTVSVEQRSGAPVPARDASPAGGAGPADSEPTLTVITVSY